MNLKYFTRLAKVGSRKLCRVVIPRCVAYPVLWGPLRGIRFYFGSLGGNGGGIRVYVNGIETEQTAAFCERITLGQTVYDIGAKVGYYSLLASR